MEQVLTATQDVGNPFSSRTPVMVFLDTYTDGWFVQYGLKKDNPADIHWKNYHDISLQEHGNLSRVILYGTRWLTDPDVLFRLHGGTQGATAFIVYLDLSVFS